MPTIRPVAHEARLSVIEHLDELRSRIVWVAVAYVVAFGLCFWQNGWILEQLNKPLASAKTVDCEKPRPTADALEQTGCFAKELESALTLAAPALSDAGDVLKRVARAGDVSQGTQTDAEQVAADLAKASRALERAAATAPRTTSAGAIRPVTLGVTEPFLTTLTVASYAALLLTLPLILFHIFAFVLPAFTPREQKVALPVMLAAPFLFIAGVAFGYFLAMPRAISFLQNYNDGQFDILVQARDYYRFTVLLLAAFGALFQIPLAVLATVRLQIITPAQLRTTRGYALLVFAILAAVITPTPDPVTMLLAMAPLVVLYEISIQISRFIAPAGPSRWSLSASDADDDPEPIAPETTSRPSGDGLD
ncbi:MAG: twin-arginine translocase subunit TatC [Baekduia sp.]